MSPVASYNINHYKGEERREEVMEEHDCGVGAVAAEAIANTLERHDSGAVYVAVESTAAARTNGNDDD